MIIVYWLADLDICKVLPLSNSASLSSVCLSSQFLQQGLSQLSSSDLPMQVLTECAQSLFVSSASLVDCLALCVQ